VSTKTAGWKLFDDDDSAVAAGTPFRVNYFIGGEERVLYFRTSAAAFEFVQANWNVILPEILDLVHCEVLFPKSGVA